MLGGEMAGWQMHFDVMVRLLLLFIVLGSKTECGIFEEIFNMERRSCTALAILF